MTDRSYAEMKSLAEQHVTEMANEYRTVNRTNQTGGLRSLVNFLMALFLG